MRCIRLFVSVGLISSLLALIGCTPGVESLQAGVSTAEQVRAALGSPASEWRNANGTTTLEFPRGPQGTVTYMATLRGDGVLARIDQVLSEPWFAKATAGMTQDEVRRLLGRPMQVARFPGPDGETWSWRYEERPMALKQFHVHFDTAGKLARTSRSDDATP